MNLIRESVDSVRWVATVIAAFFQVRPWTTLTLIIAITASKIASILAFFLPLKVILLAGSDGVPRYFRFFIDPADKYPWIIGLSIGAVACYMLSLLLDSASKRLSEAGSSEVLQGANEIAVASSQREEAQGYYRRFSGIGANGLLAVIMFSVLGLINPLLLVVMAGLITLQYLFTAGVLHFGSPITPGPTQRMVRRNLGGYLTVFTSVDFLFGFFVLLIPFLLGSGGNLLLAILSILLLRNGLGSISSMVSGVHGLWKNRWQVDPMVFRDQQMRKKEKEVSRTLREVFRKHDREARLSSELNGAGIEFTRLHSEWRDSPIKNVFTFRVVLSKPSESDVYLQHKVFPSAQLHMLEHEEFLFNYVDRSAIRAPKLVCRFQQGPFFSQLCTYGGGVKCTKKVWSKISAGLMTRMWVYEPPKALVSAFNTSRPTLQGRLIPAFLERLEVALDKPREARNYERLLGNLGRLQDVLASVPVYIYNIDMVRENIVLDSEHRPVVTFWGRWAIEPIGASLPRTMKDKDLEEVLKDVRQARGLRESALTSSHVRLANQCRLFEREAARGRYNRAISRLPAILDNPLISA